MIRVGGGNDLAESLEIFFAFLLHEIVFVGKGPPDIAIGSEPADHIPEITVVLSARHAVKPPVTFIVGAKKDEVGLDSNVAKIGNSLFEALKELGVKSREIPITGRSSFERIQRRFVGIPIVVFWENAKANFVERR